VQPVDNACADAYFIDANVFGIVFVDGFDYEPGSAHGVEFLVLVESYDVVALADANNGAVGPKAGDIDSYFYRFCPVEFSMTTSRVATVSGSASWRRARLVADCGFYLGEWY